MHSADLDVFQGLLSQKILNVLVVLGYCSSVRLVNITAAGVHVGEIHLNLVCNDDGNAAEQHSQLEAHYPAIACCCQAENGLLKPSQTVIALHLTIHIRRDDLVF